MLSTGSPCRLVVDFPQGNEEDPRRQPVTLSGSRFAIWPNYPLGVPGAGRGMSATLGSLAYGISKELRSRGIRDFWICVQMEAGHWTD